MYSSNILQIIAFVSHKRVIYTAQGTDCLPEKQKEMPSKSDSVSFRSVIRFARRTGILRPAKAGGTKKLSFYRTGACCGRSVAGSFRLIR